MLPARGRGLPGRRLPGVRALHLALSAHVRADGWGGCRCGLAAWPGLDQRPFDEGDDNASPQVVDHAISNFKSFVPGAFHGATRDRLQGYMDEFSWRYRHRADRDAFGSLLADALAAPKRTREQLKAMFAPQPPQPSAPDWRKRRAAWPGVMLQIENQNGCFT